MIYNLHINPKPLQYSALSTITEINNYYIKNSSKLYMCALDCTKAFDRVSLVLLFTKLRERKMNPLVLRCLIYTYCSQKVCINWNGAKSRLFRPQMM